MTTDDPTLGGLLGPLPRTTHRCDADCAHTIDVGHVHVLTAAGGPCRIDCPHPDHHHTTRVGEWGGD